MSSLLRTVLFFYIIFPLTLTGQEMENLLPFLLPGDMVRNASATVYNQDVSLEIKPDGEAHWNVEKTVTVWNEKGNRHASFFAVYDQFRELNDFKGAVYNSGGKKIKRVASSDLEDYGSFTSSFVTDIKMKYYEPLINDYPYMVRYNYSIRYRSSLFIDDWVPQPDYHVSVVKSTFTVEDCKEYPFKYKEKNLPEPTSVQKADKKNIYLWKVEELKALKNEPLSPPLSEITPSVMTGTEKFKIEKYEGSTGSWKDFGEWINHLTSDRQDLPDKTRRDVYALISKHTNKHDKICALYNYLQENTRYVSIQLGIGGFQPEKASVVDEVGYGDCKGLSNYMVSLLNAAGIKSYYALVNSGSSSAFLEEDFPANQFNHAIVCVPVDNDTLWLECTSQNTPCGFIGNFTGNRKALLIEKGNSRLVRTQSYTREMNTQNRKATVVLDAKGNGQATVITCYGGLQYDNMEHLFRKETEEQEKWLYENVGIPGFRIEDFSYILEKGRFPQAEENLRLDLEKYMALSGDRAFLNLNLMNRFSRTLVDDTNRTVDIILNFPFTDTDTIIYQLPVEYEVEAMPDPVYIDYPFAHFSMLCKADGNSLTFIRKLEIEKGEWPSSYYPEFVDFYKKLTKADKAMAVLIKK